MHDCKDHLCTCFFVPVCESLGLEAEVLDLFPHILTSILWALGVSWGEGCLKIGQESLHPPAQRCKMLSHLHLDSQWKNSLLKNQTPGLYFEHFGGSRFLTHGILS